MIANNLEVRKVENFSWGFTLVILGLLIQWFFSNESLAVYSSTLLIAVGVYYVGTELSEVTANDGYENLTFGLAVVVVGSSLMSFLDSSSAQIIIFILFGLFGIYYIFTGTYKVIADLTERVRAQRSKKEPPSDNDEKKAIGAKEVFQFIIGLIGVISSLITIYDMFWR